ncbi:hypothetical protein [Dinghuibacter silviterrae]|uniref:Uncharacterized protein n=1 Tax=Dinghuibacter silviterrae TaxID=1539049 RepID=A0A4R8DWR7_9BACT|nr:hypothetical protein [Dinghuibacter silviterrae]TDX01877.1 hypothetical protein EDB95_2921 [Dinghuibacter silviterrae]
MKLLLLSLAAGLMAATPTHLAKTKHFGGNVTVLIYNYSTSASIYFDIKWYDNTSGTVYTEKTVTLATNTNYTWTVDMTDSDPWIIVNYTTTPAQEMSYYVSMPDGVGNSCQTSINGKNSYSYSVNSGGFGTYEFDYNQGEGCI